MMPNNKPYKVGITGGIGTGKSVMTRLLIERGYNVIDADQIAREVVEPGSLGLRLVVETFGCSMLTDSGTLDRPKLGKRIFEDDLARLRLNEILHPLIKKEILTRIDRLTNEQIVFVDVPLLFETNGQDLYDETVLVYAPEAVSLERIIVRDHLSIDLARKKIDAQLSISEKIKMATYIIENTASLESFEHKIDLYLKALQSRQINNER